MKTNHITCISKILTDLCFIKQKVKTKNTFARVAYSKNVLTEHKEVCLYINGAQSVALEKGRTEFKNYFEQMPVPFKIYVDFESYVGSYSKKYQDHIPCSFAYKLVCVDDKFSKPIVVFRGENAAY